MKTFDISLVQGDEPCGYVTIEEKYIDLFVDWCGCKPSKWDGCIAKEIAPQIKRGTDAWNSLTVKHILGKITLETPQVMSALGMALEHLFVCCNMFPEARVEVRF